MSFRAERSGVEESTHLNNICSKIGAKILRLRRISYGSAQDDRFGKLFPKFEFCERFTNILSHKYVSRNNNPSGKNQIDFCQLPSHKEAFGRCRARTVNYNLYDKRALQFAAPFAVCQKTSNTPPFLV